MASEVTYDEFDKKYATRTIEEKEENPLGDSKLASLQYEGKFINSEGDEKYCRVPNIILKSKDKLEGDNYFFYQPVTTVTRNYVDIVGSIVLVDLDDRKHKIIIAHNEYNNIKYPNAKYKPIGIIVCPASHMQDGAARMMSLNDMDEDYPETGSTETETHKYLNWSQFNPITPGDRPNFSCITPTTYTGIINVNHNSKFNDTSTTVQPYNIDVKDNTNKTNKNYTNYSNISSDIFDKDSNIVNQYDNASYYKKINNYLAPSPFKNDGTFNKTYCKRYIWDNRDGNDPLDVRNCLSDFRGDINAKYGLYNGTRYNNRVNNNSYLLDICSKYHTEGTQPGDWYLPAAGEAGYILARVGLINKAIETIKDQNPNINATTIPINGSETNNKLWTSTEYDIDNVWINSLYEYSKITVETKLSSYIARAFHKVGLYTANDKKESTEEFSVSVIVWPINDTCHKPNGNGIYHIGDNVNISITNECPEGDSIYKFAYWDVSIDGKDFKIDTEHNTDNFNFTIPDPGHNYVYRALYTKEPETYCEENCSITASQATSVLSQEQKNALQLATRNLLAPENDLSGTPQNHLSLLN